MERGVEKTALVSRNGGMTAAAPLLSPVGRLVCCSYPVDEPALAVHRTPTGRWSVVAPCCRDLSGRTAVHRIAVLDEPTTIGGAKVIRLKERAGVGRRT